jgi:hypothetical protein
MTAIHARDRQRCSTIAPAEDASTHQENVMSTRTLLAPLASLALILASTGTATAQSTATMDSAMHAKHHPAPAAAPKDSAFAALQERGKVAMGVDQYTSVHLFDALPDGGRIELQKPTGDSAEVKQIREHLQEIAGMFARGDFSTPQFVHMRAVPGTRVMAEKKSAIRYVYSPLPKGGELRLYTKDPDALQAIHEFMAFQRGDHRAGGTH